MDVSNLLKGVKSLNDYISITQDLAYKYKNEKVQLNMSTVLSLKNVRSLEIEYFNKYHDSGAAFIIFERTLFLLPSKTWCLLGKELISLIQCWLDAVRKHLTSHHQLWWSFLKHLLHFVKELQKKDSSLNNMLVEQITDSFLDLATRGKLNVTQRCEVLHVFNLYCAGSSKEIRLALKSQFEHYFIRLSTILATCGHLPTQYNIIETLLRWLQPRQDQAVRKDAAAKWFPQHLYARSTVQIFLERPWHKFFQDARDFLNAHNDKNTDVTSVICRKLSVGKHVLVSSTDHGLTWLDMNYANKSITVLLDPRVLQALGAPASNSCETLCISSDVTLAARLHSAAECVQVTITVIMTEPPSLYPSSANVFGDGEHEVKFVIGSRCDMARVDSALRRIFEDKYEVQLDLENTAFMSPVVPESIRKSHVEDQRFSDPAKEIKRRKHSGYMIRHSGRPVSCQSPSTVSTSSLAQLHAKLEALPYYKFDREPVKVCAEAALSGVTELTEEEIRSTQDTSTTTLALRPCGVLTRKWNTESRKSQSDSEAVRRYKPVTDSSDTDENKNTKSRGETVKSKAKNLLSLFHEDIIDENSTSCLLSATIGSTDQSVINDTLERLSKSKDNIAGLLVQEALKPKDNSENKDKLVDSGINTGDGKKTQDVVVENIPSIDTKTYVQKNKSQKTSCTVVSKSTSDESNTEAINDTPISYVSVRKKNLQRQKPVRRQNDCRIFDEMVVEDFFTQHVDENKQGDLRISPTLAKKINETSSESDGFDYCLISNAHFNVNVEKFDDIEIVECLNEIVDKVCNEFEKCTAYLYGEDKGNKNTENVNIAADNEAIVKVNIPLKNIVNTIDQTKEMSEKELSKDKMPPQKKINLEYTITKKLKGTKLKTVKNKIKLEPIVIMSPITEVHNEVVDLSVKNISTTAKTKDSIKSNVKEKDTPRIRKKRKLYSPNAAQISDCPKYDEIEVDTVENDDAPLSKFKKHNVTPKSSATCYKELEKERQKYRLRVKKSKSEMNLSPKSRENNYLFDKIKDTVESDVKVTLADKKLFDNDIGIFNFTSDSDDEDFKKKKMNLQNRISTTTVDSGNSIINTRSRVKNKINYMENENTDSTDTKKKNTNTGKRKRTAKRKNSKAKARKISIESTHILVDEKMRVAAPDELNTSLVIEKPKKNHTNDSIDPAILVPQVELMIGGDFNREDITETIKNKKGTKKTEKSAIIEKIVQETEKEVARDKDDDGSISPLPGLVVEKMQPELVKGDDPLTANMEQKILKIYQEGPDAINDTNTTHNLLSDSDKHFVSVTDEQNEMIEKSNFKDRKLSIKKDDSKKIFDSNIESVRNNPVVVLVDDRNIFGNNSLQDYASDVSTKSARRTKSLKLKNKKEANKSTEVNIEKGEDDSEQAKPKSKIIRLKSNKIFEKDKVKTSNVTESKKNSQKRTCKEAKSLANLSIFDQNPLETISISDVIEMKSEKSFATAHINAHGDLDKAPPNTDQLSQRFIPRELVDMEESMKKYYIRLRTEVIDSISSKSNATKESDNDSENRVSPVRSVKRLMSDELSKWLPLQNELNKKPTIGQGNMSLYDASRWLPSRNNSESDDSSKKTTPTVLIKRLSSNDIAQWLSGIATSESNKSEKVIKSAEAMKNKVFKSKKNIMCSDTDVSDEDEKITKVMVHRPTQSRENATDSDTGEYDKGQNITKAKKRDKTSQKSQEHTPTKRFRKRLSTQSRENATDSDTGEYDKRQNITKAKKRGKTSQKSQEHTPTKRFRKRLSTQLKENATDSDTWEYDKRQNITEAKKRDKTSQKSQEHTPTKRFSKRLSTQLKENATDSDTWEYDKRQNITEAKKRDKTSQKSQEHTPTKRFSKRLSIISPIKLFDDIIPKNKIDRQHDTSVEETNQTKNTSTKNISTSQSIVKSPNKYHLRKYGAPSNESSPASKISTSTKRETSQILNKTLVRSLTEKDIDVKRRRIDIKKQQVTMPISIPSISSVDDWFRKCQPASPSEEAKKESVEDAVQNIMEKLDTDLVEINEGTMRNFINLFVKAKTQQNMLRDERQKMFEKSAARMEDLTKMLNTMKGELVDFDNRTQAMETDVMQEFQQQAMEFLRKDARNKKRMVTLLKEDVQAVLDFVRNRDDNT